MEDRHRTLRAAIDWSYNLLADAEKTLLRRVAVFVGGFTIDSAEAVCDLSGGAGPDVFDVLASLLDKSLLTRGEDAGDDEPRFGMLVAIREYGLQALRATPDHAVVRERHAEHYAAFAEAMAPGVLGRERRRLLRRVLVEEDNLRAALAWALSQPDATLTARLVRSLYWFWIAEGRFAESQELAARALAQSAQGGRTAARADILHAAGWLRVYFGDAAGAVPLLDEATDLYRELGMDAEEAAAGVPRGIAIAGCGQVAEGRAVVEVALERCRAAGDPFAIGMALTALGEIARALGETEEAQRRYEEALERMREVGNTFMLGLLQGNLAFLRLAEGDWRAAARMAAGNLALGEEFNYPMYPVYYVGWMSGVAIVRGEALLGARLFGAFTALFHRMGGELQPSDQVEYDRRLATARAAIGDEAVEAARREGAAWTLAEAIAAAAPLQD